MSQIQECEKCGNGLLDGDLLCKICGHLSGRVCKACGHHVPHGKRLCESCGNDLGPQLPFGASAPSATATVAPASADRIHYMPPPPQDPPAAPTSPHATQVLDDPNQKRTMPLEAPPTPPPVPPLAQGGGTPYREPSRVDHTDYDAILRTCQEQLAARTDLFGVFGRPASGKTVFIYALGQMLKGWPGAKISLGNYALDRNWENLIDFQEHQFAEGIEKPTARGLHFYTAKAIGRGRDKRHFSLIDIPGEQFEQIDDWTRDITHFFLTYLTHCKGLFLFLELDPETICKSAAEAIDRRARERGAPLSADEASFARQAWRFKRDQLGHMVKFLSVAATVGRIESLGDLERQKGAMMDAYRAERFGADTVKVPVALCITKADRIKDYRFDGFPAIVPGAADFLGDPWNVIETLFPQELENLKQLVPHLKIEWTSSTGESFVPKRGIGQPLGLASVFNHVIGDPPPPWALPARTYLKYGRFFGLEA